VIIGTQADKEENGEFCTPDDRAFQALNVHAKEWLGRFSGRALAMQTSVFDLPNGESYAVTFNHESVYIPDDDAETLTMIVTESYPTHPMSNRGYIYVTTVTSPELTKRFIVKQVSEHIFCYFKSGE
jgi:hypothetical protein